MNENPRRQPGGFVPTVDAAGREIRAFVVRAAGVEPAQALRPTDFRTPTAFTARSGAFHAGEVRGLDYPFTLAVRL